MNKMDSAVISKPSPVVSVIVPVYQVEAYLPACLDSLIAQTMKDFEIILVDDGTLDGSYQIMEQYARRDARIRLIRKENGGLSSARNAGLEVAQGKYIAFLDSDDIAEANWLADTVEAAEKSNADLVLYNYCKLFEDRLDPPFLEIRDEVLNLEALSLESYLYQYWMPYIHGQEAWSRLYKRQIIEDAHLQFAPNDEIFAEDTLFSAMYLMHVHKLVALSKPYIEYRQRGDSIMGLAKPKLARRLMELSVRLCDYSKEVGRDDELACVLPVLCYDKLICKGIRMDPSLEDVRDAMETYLTNETMRTLLGRLRSVRPLLRYTQKTHQGFRTQITGRLFADRWLKGDFTGAMNLVEGKMGK